MSKGIKILAMTTGIVLVLSLTLVMLGIMSWQLFWVVAIIAAIIAYQVIPRLQKPKGEKELWEK